MKKKEVFYTFIGKNYTTSVYMQKAIVYIWIFVWEIPNQKWEIPKQWEIPYRQYRPHQAANFDGAGMDVKKLEGGRF